MNNGVYLTCGRDEWEVILVTSNYDDMYWEYAKIMDVYLGIFEIINMINCWLVGSKLKKQLKRKETLGFQVKRAKNAGSITGSWTGSRFSNVRVENPTRKPENSGAKPDRIRNAILRESTCFNCDSVRAHQKAILFSS
jgi:hypothetical protein